MGMMRDGGNGELAGGLYVSCQRPLLPCGVDISDVLGIYAKRQLT
jgi:hypothetical protein